MRKALLTTLMLFLFAGQSWATTYYVRNDGGTSTQCTGLADAAYDGAGTGEACAWRSVATALPRTGSLISAGDTLLIDNVNRLVGSGQAQYEVSYSGVDIVHDGSCFLQAGRPCTMAQVPSGVDASHPTKIYGKNWASCDGVGPSNKAQIFAEKGADNALSVGNNVEVRCLDITDHSVCQEGGIIDGGTSYGCDRDCSPDGVCFGSIDGIKIDGKDNVYIENVDVHGMGRYGIIALNISDVTLDKVNLIANGMGGWDGTNADQTTFYTGLTTIQDSSISWNGCNEVYPITDQDLMTTTDKTHCTSQGQAAARADGIGTGDGTSGSWLLVNTKMNHNTADGFDMLHSPGPGDYVEIRRCEFIGNAGNPVKTGHEYTLIENSVISANCDYFNGQSFTATTDTAGASSDFNNCRAAGAALALGQRTNAETYIYNNTIYGEGDVLIMPFNACDGTETMELKNNIVYGAEQWDTPSDKADPYYCDQNSCCSGGTALSVDSQYNVFYNGKSDECLTGTGVICNSDPGLTAGDIRVSTDGEDPDFTLTNTGAAYNAADESVALSEAVDRNNVARGASWDIGAYDYTTESSTPATASKWRGILQGRIR